jgi:hypothetical protein
MGVTSGDVDGFRSAPDRELATDEAHPTAFTQLRRDTTAQKKANNTPGAESRDAKILELIER